MLTKIRETINHASHVCSIGNNLACYFPEKMETVRFSETSVPRYQNTRRHIS